jgi:hypothetical protein
VRRALVLLAVVALAGCATANADTGRVAAAGGGRADLVAAPAERPQGPAPPLGVDGGCAGGGPAGRERTGGLTLKHEPSGRAGEGPPPGRSFATR